MDLEEKRAAVEQSALLGAPYLVRLAFLPQRFSLPRAGSEPWLAFLLRQLSFPLRLRCAIALFLAAENKGMRITAKDTLLKYILSR